MRGGRGFAGLRALALDGRGLAGRARSVERQRHRGRERSASAARPSADLGGNWGQRGLRAGGTVEDAGAEITSVRLTDVEGRTFEDTVENGVVLFSSDELVTMPMRLDLIDAEGRIVHTEEWGFADE
jgi:hypothetical protein